jgi:N-methylhydantoinase B/oxoprolinase/acetone carboxylase alpha subunit
LGSSELAPKSQPYHVCNLKVPRELVIDLRAGIGAEKRGGNLILSLVKLHAFKLHTFKLHAFKLYTFKLHTVELHSFYQHAFEQKTFSDFHIFSKEYIGKYKVVNF